MRILFASLLFLITLFFGHHLVLVCGQYCDSHQQSMLLQLKKHLIFNSSFSTKLVKWNIQGGDSWDGVSCEEGRVTGLDLSDEYISAGVEDSSPLFSFHYLKTLNLASNKFHGARISSRFGNLTNLSYLNLSDAGFAGKIPNEISQLASLITLDLSGEYFPVRKVEVSNLAILVQNLTKLEELHLDSVNISAHGNEWGKALSSALPNLRVLSLSDCDLSGPIDSSLARHKYLSVVRLDRNNLSGPVPQQIFQVSTLHTLNLSSNPMLYGSLPESIGNLKMLTTVNLGGCSFSGPIPNSMSNLTRLVNLDFSDNSFTGPIPNSMSNLTRLVNLDFTRNSFTGPIPNSMSNLTQLVNLYFSFNRFTGPIPSFSSSRNLTRLKLAYNMLNGSIDSTAWEGLVNLVELDLRHNSFSGSIPLSLFKITSLELLWLYGNQFSGVLNVSSHMSSSYSLKFLDLGSNMLQGQFPEFVVKLQGIEGLDLSFNNFSGIVQLDMIRQLRNLSSLDLSYNSLLINANATYSTLPFPQLSELNLAFCNLRSFPGFLKSQSHLSHLDLSNNQIHGEIPKWIWKLPYLDYLNLSHNFLTNAQGPLQNITSPWFILDLHSNMLQGSIPILPKGASYLDYSHNKLNSVISHSICYMEYLRVLLLSNNNLSGLIPQCLTTMSSLGVLNLRKNNFNVIISDTFDNYCNLQTLDVNGNMLEGKLPKSLANCKGLEVLDFGNNQIHDTFPCYLKTISSLRVLVLRSNKFNGDLNCSGYKDSWLSLQVIDLASNNFRGKLTKEWLGPLKAKIFGKDNALEIHEQIISGRNYFLHYEHVVNVTSKGIQLELVIKTLTLFTSIDLSLNNFYGAIPEVIGEFTSLYALNLSHNALTGQIPSSIGNMKELESLDLSRNQLNGEIPTQLSSLNFLSVLDLSFNQLVGRIPTGTQLQSFTEGAFQGNTGLYGCPLTDNCTKTREIELPPRTCEDSKNEINWELVGAEIGFVVGFGIVIFPLMFWKRWRYRYYKDIDRFLFRIFPQLDTRGRNLGRRAQTRF